MSKTILITGATDGIGLETAKILAGDGHRVLLHGRNPAKLDAVAESLADLPGTVEAYVADLSRLEEVGRLAEDILAKHQTLDVLINNAGVFKTSRPLADNGMDVRFVVNTIAPYLLTRRLLPHMPAQGRVVNLSSAAQMPVNLNALAGPPSEQVVNRFATHHGLTLDTTAVNRAGWCCALPGFPGFGRAVLGSARTDQR